VTVFFWLQDVKKLSGSLQSFGYQIVIEKTRNSFKMSAFYVEWRGQKEMYLEAGYWGHQLSFEPKIMAQLLRLAEFGHQYLQGGLPELGQPLRSE
jgi:hypothetical protein